jgi:acetyl/propionyl-CoA carboxylase alpha subunit
VVTQELRNAMGRDALRLVRASGYANAGTIEFLFSGDAYYFLEMNTRIQVEHPVTEVVMGVDLVRLQIEIAAGERLRLSQLEVEPRGHAIEARLYGEDPENGFLPSTGTLEVFRPPQGPGLRNDIGVYPGWDVPPYYDSMLAKLVVHAETRPQAVARIRDALERYAVLGVTTNLGFLHWIVVQEEFVHGKTDTGFVDRHWPAPQAEPPTGRGL